ncbi:hypothetical protein [Deinococcus geothermalis]|uniref:Uncharacterized protein n=1 Tax=Deinococcus geothermalis (strain DSM 11300 / CIP 105573 / AG-3a) TaxID=319795 RepID=Q1J2P6_DEIGD|nr:hypothetical protein [Deinococcus geothermalis]ABF44238.1 hypothetical protein Dgeo_2807 [Deinococcus geothermalis DSM 11300]
MTSLSDRGLKGALHDSVLAVPLRAPQSVPYAPPRPSAAGANLAARREALERELYVWHLRRLAARRHRNPAGEAEATHRIQLVEAQLRSLARQLAEVPSRVTRPGLPYLYVITVPERGDWPAETWHLDTHTLPAELRTRLTAYLHSGTRRLPYRVTNGRYRPQRGVPEDTRALLAALMAYAQLQTG